MHALQQLEVAFESALDANKVDVVTVARWRLTEWQEDELPSLEVRGGVDRLQAVSDDYQHRVARIEITARAKPTGSCADELYTVQAEAFGIVQTAPGIDLLVKDVRLVESGPMEIGQADLQVGRVVMTFEVDYQVALDDLETIIP